MVLERKFSWNCLKNNTIFFDLSRTSSHFHPLQVENCASNSRLVVDEDDTGVFRLERVNAVCTTHVTLADEIFLWQCVNLGNR